MVMSVKIVVPELGESVQDATVARWLKQKGDAVRAGEAVVVLETDKVDLEVAAEKSGVLNRIDRPEGQDVHVGDVLGLIEESAGAPKSEPSQTPSKPEAKKPEQPAAEKQPAKPEEKPAAEAAMKSEEKPVEAEPERATPVAKRLAQEQRVELADVPASGHAGRVTKQDVEGYLAKRGNGHEAADRDAAGEERDAVPAEQEQPTDQVRPGKTMQPAQNGREERVRMSRRRRTIAARLVEAQHTAAMLTTFNEVDMTAIMELRERRKEAFKTQHNVSLGIVSFFVKAAIGALKDFPRLNAEIQGDEMVLKHYYDIGVAIGATEGLVVPVLRDAERMSFAEIEKAIKDYAQKAQDAKLSLEDLRGGTFTITNGGVFGSLLSTPILNQPQVGILGLHKIQQRPVALNGQVVIRPMMYVALSYDHRIVDGREAVQFLVRVKELVEDPERLLLEG
jgi:2-oxoglutarate dehydrogenase E2 component (dihydrolipoamide succinyltransferase)